MSFGHLLDTLHAEPSRFLGMATVISVEGSAYRHVGARMLIAVDDRHVGTISGGCLEADVIEHAQSLPRGQTKQLTYDTRADDDLVWGTGSGCNGLITIFVETWTSGHVPSHLQLLRDGASRSRVVLASSVEGRGHALLSPGNEKLPLLRTTDQGKWFFDLVVPPESLVIFGSGEDARALARFATALDWNVTVVDVKPASDFPASVAFVVSAPEAWQDRLVISPADHVAVMTHHFEKDLRALSQASASQAAYIGVLGARGRTARLLSAFDPLSDSTRLHAPVGLDLGAETPVEIALAMVAEIMAVIRRRPAGFLRDLEGPMHEQTPEPSSEFGSAGDRIIEPIKVHTERP